MAKKKLNVEKSLSRIEQIIDSIESGELALEESMTLYKEGIGLSVECGEYLKHMETEVAALYQTAAGNPKEKPFRNDEAEGSGM